MLSQHHTTSRFGIASAAALATQLASQAWLINDDLNPLPEKFD
jgi:hypothetical protein